MAVYLYAGDQIIENVTSGYFYYQDSLGNTSHVTDAAGNLLERYTYSAFGTPTFVPPNSDIARSTSAYGIRHLFQGQLWTQETGLNDYRNRVELPVMGVFLQPDPIGFKGDAANINRFCNNNAVNRIDPTGLYSALTSFGGGDWIKGSDGLSAWDWNHKRDQPAGNVAFGLTSSDQGGNDNGKFYGAVNKLTHTSRSDAENVSAEEIGRAAVSDAQAAGGDTARNIHPGKGVYSGEERTYAQYVNGSSLDRRGPRIGRSFSGGREADIPGYSRNGAVPITISHSHGPGSPRGFDKFDIPSANGGSVLGAQYISSVQHYLDHTKSGGPVRIYVPGGGQFNSSDGVNFYMIRY